VNALPYSAERISDSKKGLTVGIEGKRAIVTGAGRGLGRGIAQVLATRGVSLVITGRTPETLESIRDEIVGSGGHVEVVPGDVGERDTVDRVVDRAIESYGGIDIVVNNAQALTFDEPVLAITEESLQVPFRSGLLGTLFMMQACYPHLKAAGGGSIVNFGSSTSVRGDERFGSYVITKEAIRGLSRAAAREWGADGIRVNVVMPSGLTEASKSFLEEYPDRFDAAVEQIPLRRIGDPIDDIGRAIAALVDDDLHYLTGAMLMLDGGAVFIS
jgi:NAD(P)-dependent dehydrogenase (short-subunit alcohol dehydrogenase family)